MMNDGLSIFLVDLAKGIGLNIERVLLYPFDPGQRIFVLYVVASLAMAVAVYAHRTSWRHTNNAPALLWQFLFPRSVWRTQSAWLDVRYFFLYQIVRVFLYGSGVLAVSDWAFQASLGMFSSSPRAEAIEIPPTAWVVGLGYAFVSILALDFVSYVMHYCQHRFRFLWEFHKVHHSAPVMHPLTNYREHPVDNIVYALGNGACIGFVAAVVFALLGSVPAKPTVMGVGIFAFAFNILGYNLRHSHVWLRWPGPLVYLFGCPAHHQVHHSYHPTHINKNFAFIFPIWDLLFGTFHLPLTDENVKFGLSEQNEDYKSCFDLFWVPFRKLARSVRRPSRERSTN